jgi:peptide-methionine (S)-S-oxide reductase
MTPLHAAARKGPLALVETLIRGGAPSWQPDRKGKAALAHARRSQAPDRDAIIELLDRPVIRDPDFRAAVHAIHSGDLAGLGRLLDARPDLLRMRAIEPDCYPRDYFRDPKVFWFIANNPTLMKNVPDNIAAVARTMIARGVEQSDLDYTLELVITNNAETLGGHQNELATVLIEAGATANANAIVMALAHWSIEPVQAMLARGMVLTAPVAAALGRASDLARLLPSSTPEERRQALGLAVINRQVEAARMCLDAGADVNAFLPVHRHSTALHQAAINEDFPMMELLLNRGARTDIKDTLWDGTPLGWAMHGKQTRVADFLKARMGQSAAGN